MSQVHMCLPRTKKKSTIVSSILKFIPFESTKNITAPATWANGHGCHAFFCKFRWDMFSITSHIDMFNRTHNKIGTFMNLPRPGRKVKCVTYSPTHGSFSYYMEGGILELRIVSSLSSWQHLGHWGLPQLTNGYQVYQHLLYNSEKWLILKYSKTIINTCIICIHINTTVCFLLPMASPSPSGLIGSLSSIRNRASPWLELGNFREIYGNLWS